uniref:Uncharacterized protein n=1 Tax=Cucumis melo TaxID=3656 RepID=A0A9I9E399_CUCME
MEAKRKRDGGRGERASAVVGEGMVVMVALKRK